MVSGGGGGGGGGGEEEGKREWEESAKDVKEENSCPWALCSLCKGCSCCTLPSHDFPGVVYIITSPWKLHGATGQPLIYFFPTYLQLFYYLA